MGLLVPGSAAAAGAGFDAVGGRGGGPEEAGFASAGAALFVAAADGLTRAKSGALSRFVFGS